MKRYDTELGAFGMVEDETGNWVAYDDVVEEQSKLLLRIGDLEDKVAMLEARETRLIRQVDELPLTNEEREEILALFKED